MNKAFNQEVEMKKNGKCYPTYGLFGGGPYSEIEYLNPPISPKENYLRFIKKADYYWIPDVFSDFFEISTSIIPDNIATGYEGGVDCFGVTWAPLENGLPAMVPPGNPNLKDIADWQELTFPDVDAWDWEAEGRKYVETADPDRIFRAYIPTGLFERMIALMDFQGAAEALLEDPDETKAFLNKVADYNIALIEKYAKYFNIDAICFLDDWSAQRSPFFSEKVARDIFLPELKRIVDRAHNLGLIVSMHSCGNGVAHIPVMIDAGIDTWQFQESAVDIDEALKLAGDRLILEGYWILPEGYSEEESEAFMKNIFDRYCQENKMTIAFCDAYYMVSPFLRDKAYELGRKCVAAMA